MWEIQQRKDENSNRYNIYRRSKYVYGKIVNNNLIVLGLTWPVARTYDLQVLWTSTLTPTSPMRLTWPVARTYDLQVLWTSTLTPTSPMRLTWPVARTYDLQVLWTSTLTPTPPMRLTWPVARTNDLQVLWTSTLTPTSPMRFYGITPELNFQWFFFEREMKQTVRFIRD
jgi:hypothetical protein